VWDPRTWADRPERVRALREQLRRARRKGVTVRPVPPEALRDPRHPLRLALEALIARWLAARPMAPMGFLVDVQPFAFAEERRCFVAERAGAVVGFLSAVPVYARAGWLFEDLLRDRDAPNGTAELLVDAAMRAVAAEGSRYVTLGLAALAGATPGWLALVRRLSALLYDFDGVYAFRAKLRPDRWEPLYVSTRASHLPAALAGTIAIFDSLAAFARGRLIGFGVATLLRGPAFVVRLLAALLVPWIVLLACAGARWFPGPAAKAAWIAFDALLALALFSLAAQWRRWLGILLAVAVTADALVTAAQIALHNLHRGAGPGALAVFAVAVAAPSLAAVILWHAINHRRRGT
jgi:phosphatidylglycerol lysyltransferase